MTQHDKEIEQAEMGMLEDKEPYTYRESEVKYFEKSAYEQAQKDISEIIEGIIKLLEKERYIPENMNITNLATITHIQLIMKELKQKIQALNQSQQTKPKRAEMVNIISKSSAVLADSTREDKPADNIQNKQEETK